MVHHVDLANAVKSETTLYDFPMHLWKESFNDLTDPLIIFLFLMSLHL